MLVHVLLKIQGERSTPVTQPLDGIEEGTTQFIVIILARALSLVSVIVASETYIHVIQTAT